MPIPRKIAGRLMITIEALIVAMSTPRVVFDSATHLYPGWSRSRRDVAVGAAPGCAAVSSATGVAFPGDGQVSLRKATISRFPVALPRPDRRDWAPTRPQRRPGARPQERTWTRR